MNVRVAKLTAKWWRKKIECNQHDNGDPSDECQMAGILADLLAARNKPSPIQLDRFEEVLAEVIAHFEESDTIDLRCDYYPCALLHNVAVAAGIDDSVFPWKTSTYTTKDKVEVSDGYGAPLVEIDDSYFQEEDISSVYGTMENGGESLRQNNTEE